MALTIADSVTLVAAAAGAFLGSGSAFVLEAMRQSRAATDTRYAALLGAQFTLSMQLRTLVNIRDEYLNRVREEPNRFMLLVPFYGEASDPVLDYEALGFIAVLDEMDVLQRLHMAQDAYQTAASALRVRNDMMVTAFDVVQPRGDFDFESGTETVGVDARFARRLKGVTDGLYVAVDSAIELEHAAIEILAQAGKRLYPKREFVAVEEVGSGRSS